MCDKRRLIFSMVEFLTSEVGGEELSEDAKESLEVASQCLQTAYALSVEDVHLKVPESLPDIFKKATEKTPLNKASEPGPEVKASAEKLKTEGNELLRNDKVEEAIGKYSEAIALDPSNQVFYCNRAAAHSKLNNHYAAIEDCKRAIDMNPNYGKAYGRMGLAYSNVDKHKEATDCFEKALQLEPDNESYKTNLQMAKEKLASAGSPGAGNIMDSAFMQGYGAGAMGGGMPGGMDLRSMLNNPALMNMATSMLSDPGMQAMMGQLMSGGNIPGADGGANPAGGMEGLLQAGQRLAEQMQQSNPELVEQLRQQVQGNNGSNNPPSDQSKKE